MYGSGVLLLASTNRPWDLDPALLRPGRIDARIFVPLPNAQARTEILRIHCEGVSISEDVDFGGLAIATDFYSGAELRSVCQEAVLACEARDSSSVSMVDFTQALRSSCPVSTDFQVMRYRTWCR